MMDLLWKYTSETRESSRNNGGGFYTTHLPLRCSIYFAKCRSSCGFLEKYVVLFSTGNIQENMNIYI